MSGKITTHETIAMFLLQAILSPALKSPRAGAQTSIFCAVDESLEAVRSDDARKLLFVSKNFFMVSSVYFFGNMTNIQTNSSFQLSELKKTTACSQPELLFHEILKC